MKINLIDLTSKLISIPSWVDDKTNEAQLGEFIYDFLTKNTSLRVKKEFVTKNRFNIIAQNDNDIETLVIGHIDTVQPSENWTMNPISPKIINGKLFGLGSTDMKSGVAVMLKTATSKKLKPNTGFLFYIDEEYNFIGINKFIDDYKNKINPKKIISLDGLNLSISNGCRGLIEITCTIEGKSGPAAVPKCGINAITNSFIILDKLSDWLSKFNDPNFGSTSINVAYINGGQYQGKNKYDLILGKQGNIIANICQFTIDIRPSVNSLNSKKIIEFINQQSNKLGVKLYDYSVHYDYQSWLTPKNKIDISINKFNQIDQTGYIDIQLLWQRFKQIPCFTIGAGSINQAHKTDEFVEIDKLIKLQQIVDKLLIQY